MNETGPTSTNGASRAPATRPRARVIVIGNEKGGSGKSTAAMHLVVGLLHAGYRVGTIDADARQATLTRYIENRRVYAATKSVALPMPEHYAVQRSHLRGVAADEDERFRLSSAIDALMVNNHAIVVDTPGSDNFLSRLAHSFADTLVTPLNDSFVDLDLLAKIDPDTLKIDRPSLYSEMVWEQKKRRAMRDGGTIDWVVMRNRVGSIDARNKRHMADTLARLSRRIGFRLAPGFGDRVIFRELFLSGLTLLDLREPGIKVALTMSHIAARQEVRNLLATVGVPESAMPDAPPTAVEVQPGQA